MSATHTLDAVDICAGAGGASCGMHAAGVDVHAGIDTDEYALQSYNESLPGEVIRHDIRDVCPEVLPAKVLELIDLLELDWVHGSPPCQGFSHASGSRDPEDERNELVWSFIEWIAELEPAVVTMENVAGMQSITTGFMDEISAAFREVGYKMKWTQLNAADYGVPQRRKRIFCVAIREDLPVPSRWFPRPTHAETRTTTLDGRTLEEWRTVREAIGDLVGLEEGAELRRTGFEDRNGPTWYPVDDVAQTLYYPRMFKLRGISNHVQMDHSEDARERMADWPWGHCGSSTASRRLHPERTAPTITHSKGGFPVHYLGNVPNHNPEPLSEGAKDYLERDERHFEKHPPAGMEEVSRTVPANISKGVPYGLVEIPGDVLDEPSLTVTSRGYLREGGHHESINDSDVRRLTVREAARLQSFPDWHLFAGPKTRQQKQVGNAVPPLLQYHFAKHIADYLESTKP